MAAATVTVQDRVRERMDREQAELTAALEQANAVRDAAGERYEAASERFDSLSKGLIEQEDAGDRDEISREQREEVDAAHREVMRALQARITAASAVRDLTAKHAALDNPQEYERRVAQAEQLAEMREGSRKPSGKQAAIAILLRNGSAMHYREITAQALQSGLVALGGKTPEATMNAMLAVNAKASDTFVKEAPGVFGLLDADAARQSLRGEMADAANGAEAEGEEPEATNPEAEETPAAPKRDRSAAAKKAAETRKRNAAAKATA